MMHPPYPARSTLSLHDALPIYTSEELAETINVGAAREIVELARAARRLEKIVYYSSVFVSGDRTGRVREHELEAGQGFRNAAERSEEHTSELQSRENLVCRLLL